MFGQGVAEEVDADVIFFGAESQRSVNPVPAGSLSGCRLPRLFLARLSSNETRDSRSEANENYQPVHGQLPPIR